jgi:hypothetical protein
MEQILQKIYKPDSDGMMVTFVIPFIFLATLIFIIIGLYIQATLLESKINWATNKCVPKYMFVSGFIKKSPGLNELASTYDNFKQCVNQFKVKSKS